MDGRANDLPRRQGDGKRRKGAVCEGVAENRERGVG